MDAKITAEHLQRKAIVYVRQSSPEQVVRNRESRRLQYALSDRARDLGFIAVEVIDEDLGRTGSGVVERRGFEKLVGAVCTGEVGAVLCIEDARLARNGREWHHLIDLCGLTGTLLIDPNGVYDARLSNDRLLLGLKGSMAEFELSLLRQRSLGAIRAKAARGELRFRLPVGLCWTDEGRIELDPDRRVQEAIGLVFRKYAELGAGRQVLRWFRQQGVSLPVIAHERGGLTVWRLPQYQTIMGILTNPFYAGAYVFGRRESRVRVVEGRACKTAGHAKPRERWTVLIRDHHPGYISWAEYERNQQRIQENAHMLKNRTRKAGRGGQSLLIGLLRCGRCGRMMSVVYKGNDHRVPRYFCNVGERNHGADRCLSFGGLRPDEAVSAEILRVVEGHAVEAALRASDLAMEQQEQQRNALCLELEQARYEATLASRRYEAVDPDKRLVAAELEARWEAALERVKELEHRVQDLAAVPEGAAPVDQASLLALADDLPAIWSDPATDTSLKQRIARILIHEIVADIDSQANEIVLVIHWAGGRHCERRLPKNKAGHTGRWTDPDALKVMRRMAGQWCDREIALTLNRLRLRTGTGLTWTEGRVRAVRHRLKLPGYDASVAGTTTLSLAQAALHLGVSTTAVRRPSCTFSKPLDRRSTRIGTFTSSPPTASSSRATTTRSPSIRVNRPAPSRSPS
jgi:DNA invertase Pin-like site-specific DNA recombinase